MENEPKSRPAENNSWDVTGSIKIDPTANVKQIDPNKQFDSEGMDLNNL